MAASPQAWIFKKQLWISSPYYYKPLLNYVNPVTGKVLQNRFPSHELDSFLRRPSKYQDFFLHQYFNPRMYEIWKPHEAVLSSSFWGLICPKYASLSSQIPWIGAGDVNSLSELGMMGEESQAIAVLPRTALSAAGDPHQFSAIQQHSRNVPLRSLSFLYTGISYEAKTTI